MRRVLFALCIPAILNAHIFHQIPAINYYVDSVLGSDSNPPGLPYATIAHLTTIDAANPRPVWNARNNSVWHEQVALPRDNMTLQAYAVGTSMPLFDASDPIPAVSWSVYSGSCYQATIAYNGDAVISWVSAWANNVRMLRAANQAGCVSTAGTYWPSSDVGTSPITIYVQLSDGSNPGTKADGWVAYSARQKGVSANAATIKGVWTRRNNHNDGSLTCAAKCFIDSSRASEGTKHNILVGNGIVSNTLADEAYYDGIGSGLIVWYMNYPNGATVTFLNDTVSMQVYDSSVGGFGGHSGVGTFGTVSNINGTAINQNTAFEFTDVLTNTTATGVDNVMTAVRNATITGGNWVLNPGTNPAIAIQADNVLLNISGVTVTSTGTANSLVLVQNAGDTVSITNSNISGVATVESCSPSACTMDSSGNTLTATGAYYSANVAGSSVVANGNYYGGSPSNFAALNGTTYVNLGLWVSGTSQDASSSLTNNQALWDFGSYGAGTTPAVISNSLNPGTFDLTRTAFAMTGYSATFDGSTTHGDLSTIGLGNNFGWAMVLNGSSFSGSVNPMSGQTYTVDFRTSAGVPVSNYNGTGTATSSPSALSTGLWYFIGITCGPDGGKVYEGSGGTVSVIGTNATACSDANSGGSWVRSISVGQRGDGYGKFSGNLAQVKIMNHEPTSIELQSLYASWVALNAGRGVTVQ